MPSRRHFLRTSAIAGAGLMLGAKAARAQLVAPIPSGIPLNPSTIPKYVLPLPFPGRLMADTTGTYNVTMSQFAQQILPPPFAPTTVWGYNGSYPGPTMVALSGVPVTVNFTNILPSTYAALGLPVDPNMMGWDVGVAAVHLHGGNVPASIDGSPYPANAILPGRTVTYTYPNCQPAASLWFHDHALGKTRTNVHAGLAAYWIIRDAAEAGLRSSPTSHTGR